MLFALDMRLEVGHNNERQGYHPWGHRGDLAEVLARPLAAPMSGVAFMQRAITLLIVETKRCTAGQAPLVEWLPPARRVGLSALRYACTLGSAMRPIESEPTGMCSGTDLDNLLDYRGRTN